MLPQGKISGVEPGSTGILRARALVMDDDPLFRTLLVAILQRAYTVITAKDGAEGFYKAMETPPEIAVVDIQMPVWDGLRTLRAFREHATLRGIPLLVLSSDAAQETVLAAIQAGADDYLIKSSFTRNELLEKLQSLRDRFASERPALREFRTDSGIPHAPRLQLAKRGEAILADIAPRSGVDSVQVAIDAWE